MATAPQSRREMRQERRAMRTPEERMQGFYVHLIVFVCLNVGLAILNYRRNPENLWFQWVLMGWGIGIAFHAVRVFTMNRDSHEVAPTRFNTDRDDLPPTAP